MKKYFLTCACWLISTVAAAQSNWGDFADDTTFTQVVNTIGDSAEAQTITSEDIVIVKDGATVLTDGITFDDDVSLDFGGGAAAKTGLHKITIDLSQTGYTAGNYAVVYKAGDVDSVSVANRILGYFSVSRPVYIEDGTLTEAKFDASLLFDNATDTVILATTQTFDNTGTWTGNLSGNVTGSVGSVTGNVGGNVVGTVASVVTPWAWPASWDADVQSEAADALAAYAVATTADVGILVSGNISVVNSQTNLDFTYSPSGVIAANSLVDNWVILRQGRQTATRRITANSVSFGGNTEINITLQSAPGFTLTGGTVEIRPNTKGTLEATQAFSNTGTWTGNVSGNVTGSVGSVTGNVGGNVTGSVGSVSGNLGGNVVGSVGSVVGHTPQSGDAYARLGAPTGLSISADIAGVNSAVGLVGDVTDKLDTMVTPDGMAYKFTGSAVQEVEVGEVTVDLTPVTDLIGTPDVSLAADIAAVPAGVRTELTTELGRIDVATSTRLAPTTAGRTIDITAGGAAGIDWANVEGASSTVGLSGTTVGIVSTLTGHTPQTGDAYGRLGAPVGASISADIQEIEAITDLSPVLDVLGTPQDTIAADIAAVGSSVDLTPVTDDLTAIKGAGFDAGDSLSALKTLIDELEIESSGILTDADFENVPPQRTFTLLQSNQGLVGDETRSFRIGTSPTFAIDFRNDLPVNGRIAAVQEVILTSGTAGGITFGDPGRDRTQAKVRLTGNALGTYKFRVKVLYDSGATAEGLLTVKVVQ